MIQSSEYRIGNIVRWNPALINPGNTLPPMLVEIASLSAHRIGYFAPGLEHRAEAFADDLLQTETPGISPEELEPLLITPEIVLQAGFINNELVIQFDSGPALLKLVKNGISLSTRDSVPIKIEINYLHQLQNLYFGLTGRELPLPGIQS